MSYVYWTGSWLHVSPKPSKRDWLRLWEYDGLNLDEEVTAKTLNVIGGAFVERRPDGLDCVDIPEDLLSSILRSKIDARIVHLPIPMYDGTSTLGLVVETHPAVFYKRYRLPITKYTSVEIPKWISLCDTGRGSPSWMTVWRCSDCGGFVVQQTGTDRCGEYFTETINKQYENINASVKVPDWYVLPTCMDCGAFKVTKKDAELIHRLKQAQAEWVSVK